MPPSEMRQVEIAYMMAKYGHRAQTRKETDENGKPLRYFEHPRRVAIILIDKFNVRDWKLIVAGLLHDSLEDTKDINEEMLEHLFGQRTTQIIKLVSKVPKEGYWDRLKKYGDKEILLVKMADRIDNLMSLPVEEDDTFRGKQVRETINFLHPLVANAFLSNENPRLLFQKALHAATYSQKLEINDL